MAGMDPEFLIVGGGIGGGVLAALLGKAGRRVLVLERNPGRTPIVRPEVLWPATVDILSSLLPAAALTEAMVPFKALKVIRGGLPLVEVLPQTLTASGVQPWSTDPGATRSKLLELGTFEVRHGVEAVAVLKDGSRVVGIRARESRGGREADLRARWTVGDDGAQSKVREACGIGLTTRLFPVEFFCFEFEWPPSLEAGCPHVFLNPDAGRSPLVALGALPFPRGRGAGLIAALGPRLTPGPDLEAEGRRFLESDPRLGELTPGKSFPRDFVHVKRPWGHAGRYGAEGAMLLGDAIHPVSPAGGQGANMSVHDARALADLFLSDHPRPLEEYERRRRAANERSISITRRASDAVEGRGIVRVARRFARWLPKLTNLPLIQQQILREASRAFVD